MASAVTYEVPDHYSEFQDVAYAKGWTDGLPVVPPTAELVDRMLAGSARDRSSVVGYIAPLGAPATMEKVAVNAVLAGCLPEYLDVVVAAVEAMCDPAYQLVGPQVTTNAVAPVVIVNGPVRERIDLNCGGGCMGPGWRSNATIGRAVSLVLRNVGGARPPVSSKSVHGQPGRYTFCFGENEENTPWEPLHVERGFAADTSTVTVVPISGTTDVNSGNYDADEALRIIGNELGSWGNNGVIYSGDVFVSAVVVISPDRARLLAADGLSKQEVKRRLWEYGRTPVDLLPYRGRHRTPLPTVIDGQAYPTASPEDIMLVVAGAIEPYHATAMPGFTESMPVTRPIGTS